MEVNFGDKEKIRITKRPRKIKSEIIDIYSNTYHIGMFVGIERRGDELLFGPAGINRSHSYRGILNYVFVRLLEYFGLDKVKIIMIDVPEELEFKNFLLHLGFLPKMDRLVLEVTDESMKHLFVKLEEKPIQIESQVGQLTRIISVNDPDLSDAQILEKVDMIVEKIKKMDPIGKKFWDNRKIAQINYYLTTAALYPDQLIPDEFLEMTVKTIIGSLTTVNRGSYLEEILNALDAIRIMNIDYVQNIVMQLREVVPDQIAKLPRDHLRKWITTSMRGWMISDQVELDTRKNTIANSQLMEDDFGRVIQRQMHNSVTDLVGHYNGKKIFFGVNNRF